MRYGNRMKDVRALGNYLLKLTFEDEFEAELDLAPLVNNAAWGLLRPLQNPDEFAKVRIENGTLAFTTGYDICPDVLRYWCEIGRVCSQEELDAAFAPAAMELRDKPR